MKNYLCLYCETDLYREIDKIKARPYCHEMGLETGFHAISDTP